MKLIKVLETVNQIEKSSFLKIVDGFCAEKRKCTPDIDQLLSQGEGAQLKNMANRNIVELFTMLSDCYSTHLANKLEESESQLDILVDIFIRDGNAIMSREWFYKLYRKEIARLRTSISGFKTSLKDKETAIEPKRKRDYLIYQACLRTAYHNDEQQNRDKRISWDERSVLRTLAEQLELSNEEVRWITYTVLPLEPHDVDTLITCSKEAGIVFFNRRTNTIYVPDEIVWQLRANQGIEIATKYFRRILRHLSEAELNLVCRKHGLAWKKPRNDKIQDILNLGTRVTTLLTSDIYRDSISKADRASRVQTLVEKELQIDMNKYGRSLEEKIERLVDHYNGMEKDETTSLSADGYNRMLSDLREAFPELDSLIEKEFELQQEEDMQAVQLVDYGIKPRDVLYLLLKDDLRTFCTTQGYKSRGNVVANVINAYRNIDDMLIENIELVGNRDVNGLQEKGLPVKESELGVTYERLTRKILSKLGLEVDEKLRKKVNTSRHQMDVLVRLADDEVLIVECKTKKDRNYNKYTETSRQLKSYEKLCEGKGLRVRHILIVSSEFSDDFVNECEYDSDLSLSLITSRGLVTVLDGFDNSKKTEFPIKLLLKAGLLNEERIVKVLNR